MINNRWILLFVLSAFLSTVQPACGLTGPALREAAQWIVSKFGKGVAGQTVEEVAQTTSRVVAHHGEEALPLLRMAGHAGFKALDDAGAQATDVIRLYLRRGDDAIWIVTDSKKLSIFLKHGDSAADAMLKHPGIADDMILRYGDDAVGALNNLSRQNAQRLGMVAENGLLTATTRSGELLPVIRRYGDAAMDFVWKNKGALAVSSVLVSFLNNPDVYLSGAKDLVVDMASSTVAKETNWTLIIALMLSIGFLPFIVRSIRKAIRELKRPVQQQAGDGSSESKTR